MHSLRWVWVWVFFACFGCGDEQFAPPHQQEAVQVDLLVDSRRVAADTPATVTLTTRTVDGFEIDAPAPLAEGLEVVLLGEDRGEEEGYRVHARRFQVFGEPGSYLIGSAPIVVTAPDGTSQDMQVSPIALDIGVQGPTSDLEGVLGVERPDAMSLWWLLAAAGLLGLLWWGWRRFQREDVAPAIPLLPPHVEAMRAWKAALSDDELDDHARALMLSSIFRRYLERRYGWMATAFTTREIRLQLLAQSGVTGALTERASRLLGATDLLKFARQGGGEQFFGSLDEDFRTFLSATRQLETPAQSVAGA